jgi:hypothetical protein
MRRPATDRRIPPAPTNEALIIQIAADALLSVITNLCRRVQYTGTPRSVAHVLLAEAHIDEAVGLLRTIQPNRSVRKSNFLRPALATSRQIGDRVRLATRRQRAHSVRL